MGTKPLYDVQDPLTSPRLEIFSTNAALADISGREMRSTAPETPWCGSVPFLIVIVAESSSDRDELVGVSTGHRGPLFVVGRVLRHMM